MKLLLATRNRGKIREFEQLFAGLPVTIATFDQVALPAVEEDGDSFEQNAAKKALEVARATRMLVLSDDSGLEVDALGGRPGVHSARFAGPNASDADNNQKLVRELASLAGAELSARFRVVLALADLDGPLGEHVHFERAACEGRIRLTPSGHDGFGYDPYFVPHGFDRSLAELSAEEKNRISHRAKASAQLRVFLERYLATRPRTDRAR